MIDLRFFSYILRVYPARLSESLIISDISESDKGQTYILEVNYQDVSGYITSVYKTNLIKYPFTLGTPIFTKEFSEELVIENKYNEDSLIRLTLEELSNMTKDYIYTLVYRNPSRLDITSSQFYRRRLFDEIIRQEVQSGYADYNLNNGSIVRIYTYDPTPIIDESGVKSYKLMSNYGIFDPNINTTIKSYKKAALIIPMDRRDPNMYTLISNNEIVILESEKLTFNGEVSDDAIAKIIIDIWNKNVYGGNLKIGTKQIKYRSPIPNLVSPSLNTPIPPPPPNPNPIPKKKLSFLLPQKPIKVKEDVGLLKVYLGMPTNQEGLPNQEGFVFGNTEATELDEEFLEDELNATLIALDVEQVSKIQLYDPQTPIYEDEDESNQDAVQVAAPVNIQPATSLDYIFLTAANYASKTKNKKKLTYYQFRGTNSAQLCGIGARCIAAALLGDESPIKVSGHADWFSFKEKPTQGKHADLSKTGYYQYKTRITVDNYLKDKSKWQIGDVVACGYKNDPWGHIQTWTGVKWCSDFKQNSILNFYKVDPNTFALWRLNEKGVERVKNQLAYYNSLVKK